jgi:hypothetical protein
LCQYVVTLPNGQQQIVSRPCPPDVY